MVSFNKVLCIQKNKAEIMTNINNKNSNQQIINKLIEYLKEQKTLLNENDNQKDMINNILLNIEDLLNDQNRKTDNNLRVLDIQEKERQRIARDLHDSSLQNLTHLIHKIELAGKYIDSDVLQAKLELALINKHIKEIIEDIRNTIFDLRPMSFDDLGLRDSIERLIANLNSVSDIEIKFNMGNINCNDPLILMTALRIIQECTTNAVKHSEGKTVNISVQEKNNDILITVADDGKGFNYKNALENLDNHYGLKIIEERVKLLNGNFSINSDESGTKTFIEIPVN